MRSLSTLELARVTGAGPRDCAVATWSAEDARKAQSSVAPAAPFLGSKKLGDLMYGLRAERALGRVELAEAGAATACDPGSVRYRLSP